MLAARTVSSPDIRLQRPQNQNVYEGSEGTKTIRKHELTHTAELSGLHFGRICGSCLSGDDVDAVVVVGARGALA